MEYLKDTHDLRLDNWGPYTKKYIGISHIADNKKGLRFDLSVFPGFYRRRVDVPNVMWESGYHPWEASADLSYYCHRHELEWKDRVYTDISFIKLDDRSRLIRCECVNNTELDQNIVLHYMAYLNFPPLKIYSADKIYPCSVEIPDNGIWVDALDYEDLVFALPRPTDNLVPDGLYRGEIRQNGFVKGSGLGTGFGKDKGDKVIFRFILEAPMENCTLLFRYRVAASRTSFFDMNGVTDTEVAFKGNGDFSLCSVLVGNLAQGEHLVSLIARGGEPIELDGFAVIDSELFGSVKFTPVEWGSRPDLISGPIENSLILKYMDCSNYYGVAWAFDSFQVREFLCSELDTFMRHTVHNHVSSILRENDSGHFTNVFLRPVALEPNSKKIIYGMVCEGSREEVEKAIIKFKRNQEGLEEVYSSSRSKTAGFRATDAGKGYLFSQERMAATTLCNVVYPVYARRSYIKHNTPGRWWDCLYTWDSGFIGLGLLELDEGRAIDCLNAYVTEPGDKHGAFIHHGSPVPTQFYLFLELWNRTQSKELLKFFYPRLKQYHRFLCGRYGSSTTGVLKSNLIKTWDYFYNSGGWDDYPPQVYVNKNKLRKFVAPVINTAQCIRTAKILKMMACAGNLNEDIPEFEADITRFTEALQKYSWDEESGYYGYVSHDENGRPEGILRYENGVNYNMGMDGAYPLIAGICTETQEKRLIDHLMSEGRMWTGTGISTVDQSAPYYRTDGYWNGAVWMPHQWFIWKTMLDIGRPELAYKIAKTGLEVWKKEVDDSYSCFEHFMVQSGRGAGWHQFGGLSTPVMSWFGAYYRPGRLTTGFDLWVQEKNFNMDNTSLNAVIKLYGRPKGNSCVIVTMKPEHKYRILLNGEEPYYIELLSGVFEIIIPNCTREGNLEIF